MLFRRSCTYNVEQSTRHYAKVKHCIATPHLCKDPVANTKREKCTCSHTAIT